MADSVKNVTFRFKADTSQIMRIIDDLNKAIAKTQSSLSTFKIAGDAKQIKEQLASINKKLEIQADTRQARREINELNKEIVRIQKQPAGGGTGFLDTLKGGLAAFGIVATADALVDLGKSTIQAAVDFEKLTASFRALIGDKERADQAIKDIQQFALQTPFDVTQIAAAGKTLLGYGINVDDLIPTLKQLGDVSAASGGDIGRVALAFGQVAAKGKLQGEEIRQLVNVGFNPLQEISKATGESMAALAKRVEEGRVSFDEVAEAFRIATSEGGRFFNLAATLNDTLGGQIQKLGEQINLFKIEVGSIAGEDLRPLIEEITRLFVKITEFTQYLRQNALALGLVKAALGFVVALLFKSVNAFLANLLATKNWSGFLLSAQKNVLAFSFALKANTFAIGTNTTAQRTAAVATTVWDGATKVLTVTTNLFKSALTGLFNIIKTNPLGVLITAYTLLNALKERNAEITREEFLQQKGLIDIDKEARKIDNQTEAQIKAKQKVLVEDFKSVTEKIRATGVQNEASQKAIEFLEQEYNLNLKGVKALDDNTNARNKAIKALNETLEKQKQYFSLLEKRQNIIDKINRAELDLVETIRLETSAQDERKEINKQLLKDEEKLRTTAIEFAEGVRNPAFDEINDRIKTYRDRLKEINEKELPQFGINSERDQKLLAKLKIQLFDINTLLLGFGTNVDVANKKIKAQKDELEKLRKIIRDLTDDIAQINSKNISLQIDQLPEITEQEQRIKAQARFKLQTEENEKLKQLDIRKLQDEIDRIKKDGEEKIELAKQNGENTSKLQAKLNKDLKDAQELYDQGVITAEEKRNAQQKIINLQYANEIETIGKDWRQKDLKNLQDYTDESIKELQDLRERTLKGRKELLDSTIEEFGKSGIGQGKNYRTLITQYSNSVIQGIRDIQSVEDKAADIRYQREVDRINKTYKFERQAYTGSFDGLDAFVNEQNALEIKVNQEKLNALNLARQQYLKELKDNEKNADDAKLEESKRITAKLKEVEKERTLRIIDGFQQTIDAAIQTAQTIIEIEQRKNDELIQLQQERVDKAREIADKGNAALLEAEEKRLTELQKKRARFVRQQQGLILAQTIAESTLAIARAAAEGGGWASAITIAATLAALAAGIAQARAQSTEAIGGFAEGGWTGKGGKYEPAGIVHREEFVVKKGPAEKFRPMLEQMNRGRDPLLAAGMGQQVIMINNVGVEERLARIEKAIAGQDRMQLTIDESGIHGIVSHYQWKNQRIRNKTR